MKIDIYEYYIQYKTNIYVYKYYRMFGDSTNGIINQWNLTTGRMAEGTVSAKNIRKDYKKGLIQKITKEHFDFLLSFEDYICPT